MSNVRWMVAGWIALMPAADRGRAATPAAGLYWIQSGTYSECCGFVATPYSYPLPQTNQAYVQLTLDAQGTFAQMAILADDLHTVFQTAPGGPVIGFTFFFTNGEVLTDQIRFESSLQIPENPDWSYRVSNIAGGLVIQGIAHTVDCCDVPTQFWHTNVLAVPLATDAAPVLSSPHFSSGGGLQFTVGNGRWGQTNVIEISTDLVHWSGISTNVFSATACPDCPFIDFEDPDSPRGFLRRFYRSYSLR